MEGREFGGKGGKTSGLLGFSFSSWRNLLIMVNTQERTRKFVPGDKKDTNLGKGKELRFWGNWKSSEFEEAIGCGPLSSYTVLYGLSEKTCENILMFSDSGITLRHPAGAGRQEYLIDISCFFLPSMESEATLVKTFKKRKWNTSIKKGKLPCFCFNFVIYRIIYIMN